MRPPGWPAAVPDPDDPEFEDAAIGWLWDVSSLERSTVSVWGQHPRALAFRVSCDIDARLEGLRTAYAQARVALTGAEVALEIALAELEREAADLLRWQREVSLVEEALNGHRWRGRL